MWTPAYDADGQVRDGAWVAEVTGLLDLAGVAEGDAGDRAQGTPAPRRATADHRRRRQADHRVRHQHRPRPAAPTSNCGTAAAPAARTASACAKDTGLTNLPLHDFTQNQIWCAIVALACELTAWMQMLALHRTPGPPLGTQTPTATAVLHRRAARPHTAAATACTCPAHAPWAGLMLDAHDHRAAARPRPG